MSWLLTLGIREKRATGTENQDGCGENWDKIDLDKCGLS